MLGAVIVARLELRDRFGSKACLQSLDQRRSSPSCSPRAVARLLRVKAATARSACSADAARTPAPPVECGRAARAAAPSFALRHWTHRPDAPQRRRIAVFVHQREFDRARLLHGAPPASPSSARSFGAPRTAKPRRDRHAPAARASPFDTCGATNHKRGSGLRPRCAIQLGQQTRRKAPRDPAARKLPQIRNAGHADAAQRIPMRPARPQHPDRQIGQRCGELAHDRSTAALHRHVQRARASTPLAAPAPAPSVPRIPAAQDPRADS